MINSDSDQDFGYISDIDMSNLNINEKTTYGVIYFGNAETKIKMPIYISENRQNIFANNGFNALIVMDDVKISKSRLKVIHIFCLYLSGTIDTIDSFNLTHKDLFRLLLLLELFEISDQTLIENTLHWLDKHLKNMNYNELDNIHFIHLFKNTNIGNLVINLIEYNKSILKLQTLNII